MKKRILVLGILMIGGTFLISCGIKSKQETTQDEKKVLVLGVFQDSSSLNSAVNSYNEKQEDYRIEIKEYSGESINGSDALELLKMEIAAGKGPDIMDFGYYYSESAVAGKITEDLYPYMQEDDTFQMEDYFSNVFDSFSMGGHLYVITPGFWIRSFAGKVSLLGDKSIWTTQDLMELYLARQDGTILYPGDTGTGVFGYLYTMGINDFVDWEKGECNFDSEEFINMLEFSSLFSKTLDFPEDTSISKEFTEGRALLYPATISDVWEIGLISKLFNEEEVTYIGYPVSDKDISEQQESGNVISGSGIGLSICINSKYKDESWHFIRSFLEEEYQNNMEGYLPVLRSALDNQIEEAITPEYNEGKIEKVRGYMSFEGEEAIELTTITEADGEKLIQIIESTSRSSSTDDAMCNIIGEEANYFLNGEKSAEEVANIIQNRVKNYVSERVK